jgi:Zn-dependent peptidase ImmA (M78 family)
MAANTSQPQVNPDMLILARESRGLTQSALADRTGMTQSKVSKLEAGLLPVSPSDLALLARVLDYPEHFFAWHDPVYGFPAQEMFHRKRQKTTAQTLAAIHAQMNIRRMQVARLLRSAEIDGDGFRHYDPDEYNGDVEEIARLVRASWLLPSGPVKNVTEAIEHAGGIVIPHDFRTRQVDAVSQWVPGLPPIFFVNADFPADRLRWTLCHELGHILMHYTIGPDAEREADRFAAEFLLPSKIIRPQLYGLSLPVLANLKQYWKVSMQALLRHAANLGTITPRQARTLWMKMSQLGYRTHEPNEIPSEVPTLFREILDLHRTQLQYSLDDLGTYLADNHVRSLFEHSRFTVVA